MNILAQHTTSFIYNHGVHYLVPSSPLQLCYLSCLLGCYHIWNVLCVYMTIRSIAEEVGHGVCHEWFSVM